MNKRQIVQVPPPGRVRQRGALWDTLKFGPGITPARRLFYEPVGAVDSQDGQVKTITDTNMQRSAELPPPEAFIIDRISFRFSQDIDPRQRIQICEQGIFTLYIGQRSFWTGSPMHLETSFEASETLFFKCSHCRSVLVTTTVCTQCGSGQVEPLIEARAYRASDLEPTMFQDLSGMPLYLACVMPFHVELTLAPGTLINLCTQTQQPAILKVWLSGYHDRGIA